MKEYKGNVEITKENASEWAKKLKGVKRIKGDLYICSNATLSADALTSVGGDLYIYSNATLSADALTSVGGYLYICSNATLEKQLYPNCKKNKWYITEFSSEYIINENPENAVYRLNNVEFDREWFIKIKNDELMPAEVFAIDNVEHRRIAYQYMDKLKMKSLKDYKVLDETIDNAGNPMRIVSFTIQNMKKPLMFYNCYCPSTKREYFLGTNQSTCVAAKASMFGLTDIDFVEEW